MSAAVLDLAAFLRRKAITTHRLVSERLYCLHCGLESYRMVVPGQDHYDCRGCDETASVPHSLVFPV